MYIVLNGSSLHNGLQLPVRKNMTFQNITYLIVLSSLLASTSEMKDDWRLIGGEESPPRVVLGLSETP